MKKFLPLAWLLPLLLSLSACSGENGPNPAAVDIPAVKQPVQAFGIVKALETTEVTAPFALKINKILVKEGQPIAAGDILAEYDGHEAEYQLKLAEQELTAAKTKVQTRIKMLDEKRKLLEAGTDPELLKLEKSLEAAKIKYLAAAEDVSRLKALKDSAIATEKDFQDSSAALELSRLSLEELQLTAESLRETKRKEIRLEDLEIRQELSDIQILELQTGQIKDKMSSEIFQQNKVISPVSSGIIENTGCRQGTEAAEKSSLFTIANADTLIVEAYVDEQFIRDVHLGARAYIIPESDRSLEYKGKVTFIASMAVLQNSETVITVQITPDSKDMKLPPGSNAEISISAE